MFPAFDFFERFIIACRAFVLLSMKRIGIVLGVFGAVALLLGLVLLPRKRADEEWSSQNKIDTYWEVGDFELVDQHGEPFSSDALEGKIWLANFVFTSCAVECPILTHQLSLVRRKLGQRDDIAFVSFSVDPQSDTPERLANYSKPYGEDPRWSLLTGEIVSMTELITRKFLLPMSHGTDGSSPTKQTVIEHSDKMLVIDGKGVVRYFCSGLNSRTVESLTDVVQVLLQESGIY